MWYNPLNPELKTFFWKASLYFRLPACLVVFSSLFRGIISHFVEVIHGYMPADAAMMISRLSISHWSLTEEIQSGWVNCKVGEKLSGLAGAQGIVVSGLNSNWQLAKHWFWELILFNIFRMCPAFQMAKTQFSSHKSLRVSVGHMGRQMCCSEEPHQWWAERNLLRFSKGKCKTLGSSLWRNNSIVCAGWGTKSLDSINAKEYWQSGRMRTSHEWGVCPVVMKAIAAHKVVLPRAQPVCEVKWLFPFTQQLWGCTSHTESSFEPPQRKRIFTT